MAKRWQDRWQVWRQVRKWKAERWVISAALALPLPDRWDRPLRDREKFLEEDLDGQTVADAFMRW